MAINLTQPITVPEQTATKIWVRGLNIIANDVNEPVRVFVRVCPMTDNGTLLLEQTKTFIMDDVLTQAQTDIILASGIGGIYAVIQNEVTNRGLYSPVTGSTPDSGSV